MENESISELYIEETKKEKIIRKLKNAIFQSYYLLIMKIDKSTFPFIFFISFEFIQLLTLTIFHIKSSVTNSEYSQPSNTFHEVIPVLRLLRTFITIIDNKSTIFSVTILYLSLGMSVLHYLYLFSWRNVNYKIKVKDKIIIKAGFQCWYYVMLAFTTFMTIPWYVVFFSFFQCDTTKTSVLNIPNLECNGIEYYIHLSISCVTLLAVTVWGVLNCLFLNDNQPNSRLPYSSAFNEARLIFFILKILLSALYAISFKSFAYLKSTVTFVLLLILAVIRVNNSLFANQTVGKIIIIFEFSILFYSVVGLINAFSKDNKIYLMTTFLIEVFTGVSFGVVGVFILSKFNSIFTNINKLSFKYEYIAFHKWVTLMHLAKSKNISNINLTMFIAILEKHILKCKDQTCRCDQYLQFIKLHYSKMTTNFMAKSLISKKTIKFNYTLGFSKEFTSPEKKNFITKKKSSLDNCYELNDNLFDKDNEDLKIWLNFNEKDRQWTIEKIIHLIIRIIFEEIIKMFPKSSRIRIEFSYLMLFYLDNYFKALFELMKIPINTLSIQGQYEIFLCKRTIEDEMQKELFPSIFSSTNIKEPYAEFKTIEETKWKHDDYTISMETILTLNKIANKLLDLISSTSKEAIKFWQEILGFNWSGAKVVNLVPNQQDHASQKAETKNKNAVYKYAVNISKNMGQMSELYCKLRQNDNFCNKIVFQLYAEFLEKVICNEQQSKDIKTFLNNTKDHLEIKEKDNILIFKDGKINMDDIGVCVMSGDLSKLGQICHCNLQFGNIFKYEKDDWKNESINMLCPSYIGDLHNQFIWNYLETGRKHILGKNKWLFGLRSDGILVPIIVYVKVVPNWEHSIRFIGWLKKLSKSHPFWKPPQSYVDENGALTMINSQNIDNALDQKSHENIAYMLTTESGQVFGITKNVLKLFGVPWNILWPSNSSQFVQKKDIAINNQNNSYTKNNNVNTLSKVLDIKSIFNEMNSDNFEIRKRMKSEVGMEMTIETSSLKDYYNDFIESLQSGNSILLNCLRNFNPSIAFRKQQVFVKLIEIMIYNNTLQIKIFKINKLKFQPVSSNNKRKNYWNNKFKLFSRLVLKAFNSSSKKRSTLTHGPSRGSMISPVNTGKSIKNEIKNNMKINDTISPKERVNRIKSSWKNLSLPFQLTLFYITFITLLFVIFSLGTVEFLLSGSYSKYLLNYNKIYKDANKSSLYLVLIVQWFQTYIFLNNDIYSQEILDRQTTKNKLQRDISNVIEWNNELDYYFNKFDKDIRKIYNQNLIYFSHLKTGYQVVSDTNYFSFLVNQIPIKISLTWLDDYEKWILDNKNKWFYYNQNFISGLKIEEKESFVTDWFYIVENYSSSLRIQVEKITHLIVKALINKNLASKRIRIYLCYIPFILIFASWGVFVILWNKIIEYKLSIWKVFYLVNKKYGYEIIKRCKMFLEYTSNFIKYTKQDVDMVMKQLAITIQPEEDETNKDQNGTAQLKKNINEIENIKDASDTIIINTHPSSLKYMQIKNITDDKSSNASTGLLKRHKTLGSGNMQQKKRHLGGTLINEQQVKTMQFWEREEKEKQNFFKEKNINEKVSNELLASKKELNKKILIIVLQIILLFIVIIIYFILCIVLNLDFDSTINSSVAEISLFMNRGWIFTNFIFYYRQMIFSNSDTQTITSYDNFDLSTEDTLPSPLTPKDLFNVYMHTSYNIETNILLLTNDYLRNINKVILKQVLEEEIKLNSDDYCRTWEKYEHEYYSMFWNETCDTFYSVNNGWKDNIRIIYSYLQSQKNDYFNKDFDHVVNVLRANSSFINNNQLFISQGVFDEIEKVDEGVKDYINKYKNNTILRYVVMIWCVIVEICVFFLIWRYLKIMLIKDKAILNIIPNEAIFYSQKVKNALFHLNNYK